MDSQLEAHTLSSILRKEGKLESGICAQTEGLSVKMEVIGYIPIPVDDAFDFLEPRFLIGDIKNNFIIGPDRIKLSDSLKKKTYPITKRIVISEERYKLTNTLTLLQYEVSERLAGSIKQYKKNHSEVLINQILKLSEQFERNNDYIYYKTQPSELVMYRFKDIDHPMIIANNFLCLCSYINTITGKIEYDIYNPDELIEIIS